MYNVFTNIILTSKGKVCVRASADTMDAQAVYASLQDAYNDQLSSQLSANKLRAELTVIKLDDKWRKSFETFLNFWTTKVQDLESIEDKAVDDDTKRTWLTNTLQGQKDMDAAIRQAITTELTIGGFTRTAGHTSIPWSNFYQMVLSTAKLLDSTREKQNGRRQEANRAQRGNNSNNTPPKPYTKYTGPNMTMQAGMKFSNADWAKLTKAQKSKLRELKLQKRQASGASPNSTIATHSTTTTPTVSAVSSTTPNSDIRNLLSNSTSRESTSAPAQVVLNGRTYTLSSCVRKYAVSRGTRSGTGALIDGGANGGLSGSDVTVLAETLNTADVTGIAENTLSKLKLCTVAALIQSHKGPIIGIFHQYAHLGKGKTIHSVTQLRHFGTIVDDTPRQFNGKHRLITLDGYLIPLSICECLPYIKLSTYPHVIFTSDVPWEPQLVNDEYPVSSLDLDENEVLTSDYHPDTLNDYGELHSHSLSIVSSPKVQAHRTSVSPVKHDPDKLSPNFGFVPIKRIQHTLDHTTQFARLDTRLPLRKHFKSRFPAANVSRLNEVVATDTFFFDTPAMDDGIMGHGGTTMLQLFCGCTSLLTAVYPMRSENNMVSTLEKFIHHYGAPTALFSDNAKAQIGRAVNEILRMYAIKDFQCEPYHQHQNFSERRIQEVKKLSNTLLDRTGSPPSLWLLCVKHVVYILNRLSTESLHWKTSLEAATGQQPDISAILAFRWYEPVYFKHYGSHNSFPSQS